MDPRQFRTRQALAAAVLELAAANPIADLTAGQIAERAGVHRSTFYEHATSPVDLLEDVLRDELDVLRERFLLNTQPADVAAALTGVTEAVLLHVDQHAEIYRRGLGPGSGSASLHAMLSQHFQGSTRLLLAQSSLVIPLVSPGYPVEETVVHYIADGAVGAIEVWLAGESPRDPAAFLGVFAQLVPAWWPTA